ncbi:MAG TPA: multidrug effflux MFS transporter [Sedimentisphaerales bacterium]|nr:multidrug effflux MFS transporter [Sedimentisphaerales bacterium]HNU28302.1 multidrug effflux MFS transporter [Sedimentisphaerales bacterium]
MKSNGRSLYVVFLAAIAAVPAMATDMYLAAMPTLAQQWGVPDSRVALSLVLWFAGFSVFLLVCGPLSDKYGRRPVLLAGLALFTAATVACSLATNVAQLILFRILQGIGAAGPSSMCMAICRDRYEGPQRKHILAWIGIILGLAPMIAPSVGAAMLKFANWRGIFVTQAVLGGIVLLASWRLFRETAAERVSGHFFSLMGRYGRLARNHRYLLSVTAMGLIIGPFYGFIAFAPIVYIKIYGLSNHAFATLFGLNALMGMSGAFVCTRITRMLPDTVLLTICLIGCAVGGAGLLLLGGLHYGVFAACMCAVTFFCGMSRPLSNHLILDQVRTDIGSASSFIVFYQFMVGALCMKLVTASWQTPIRVFGLLAVLAPVAVLAVWPVLLWMLRKPREPDLVVGRGERGYHAAREGAELAAD